MALNKCQIITIVTGRQTSAQSATVYNSRADKGTAGVLICLSIIDLLIDH